MFKGGRYLMMAGALVFGLGLGAAHAQLEGSPCCAVYDPCEGDTIVKGNTPGAAGCEDSNGNFRSEPNAGWRCNPDVVANATGIPDREAISGCAEAGPEVCIGGAITADDAANGCAWVAGQGIVGSEPNDDADACTENAVFHCCLEDACI